MLRRLGHRARQGSPRAGNGNSWVLFRPQRHVEPLPPLFPPADGIPAHALNMLSFPGDNLLTSASVQKTGGKTEGWPMQVEHRFGLRSQALRWYCRVPKLTNTVWSHIPNTAMVSCTSNTSNICSFTQSCQNALLSNILGPARPCNSHIMELLITYPKKKHQRLRSTCSQSARPKIILLIRGRAALPSLSSPFPSSLTSLSTARTFPSLTSPFPLPILSLSCPG